MPTTSIKFVTQKTHEGLTTREIGGTGTISTRSELKFDQIIGKLD